MQGVTRSIIVLAILALGGCASPAGSGAPDWPRADSPVAGIAFVHEMAHNKLRALGVSSEHRGAAEIRQA